ncbi:MAG: rRNA maturation RNase YbeY [Bacteroidales bacterium]|nr:rRNA maturation RNase YbeY [Bacteroidales bacterium]
MVLFHSETRFQLRQKMTYKKWLTALAATHGKKLGDINYIFCDDNYLLQLNLQYLQHDTLTDIITFDYVEGDLLNGDIYISVERVRENAEIFGVTFDEELLRVLAHGLLHLCGFKDKSKKDAAEMRSQEAAAMTLFYNLLNN